jgi:hypothetical protein
MSIILSENDVPICYGSFIDRTTLVVPGIFTSDIKIEKTILRQASKRSYRHGYSIYSPVNYMPSYGILNENFEENVQLTDQLLWIELPYMYLRVPALSWVWRENGACRIMLDMVSKDRAIVSLLG